MSKAVLDGFINSIVINSKRRYDLLVRRYLGKNQPHLITITKDDFRKTVSSNFLKAMAATGKKTYPGDKDKLIEIADKVFADYPDKFNGYANISPFKERHAVQKGDKITIYLPKYTENVTRAFKTLSNIHLKKGFIRYSKEQAKVFSRATQFLHTGGDGLGSQTVGSEQTRILGNVAKGEKVGTGLGETNQVKGLKQFVTDEELESAVNESLTKAMGEVEFSTPDAVAAGRSAILSMVDKIDWLWDKGEKNSNNIYQGTIVVKGTLGPSVANEPGAESLDWKNLRPQLEAAIFKEMEKSALGFVTVKGSQSPRDKIIAGVEATIINNLVKAASKGLKIKAPKLTPQERAKATRGNRKGTKSKTVKSSTTKIGSLAAASGGRTSSATKKNARSPQSLLKLQALLNARLPKEVMGNMKLPGLQNRSGRFASSVRVQNIVSTPKGFPSIGYTYQKNPYQIFEQGAGKAPWGNSDRDPRAVIEKSMRDIAADLLKARFYTRRL
jgi:hypothetical protein